MTEKSAALPIVLTLLLAYFLIDIKSKVEDVANATRECRNRTRNRTRPMTEKSAALPIVLTLLLAYFLIDIKSKVEDVANATREFQ